MVRLSELEKIFGNIVLSKEAMIKSMATRMDLLNVLNHIVNGLDIGNKKTFHGKRGVITLTRYGVNEYATSGYQHTDKDETYEEIVEIGSTYLLDELFYYFVVDSEPDEIRCFLDMDVMTFNHCVKLVKDFYNGAKEFLSDDFKIEEVRILQLILI